MATASIHLAESALNDFHGIIEWYVEQNVPDVGHRLVRDILEQIEMLADHPDAGRVVPEFGQPFLRELIRHRFESSTGGIGKQFVSSGFGAANACCVCRSRGPSAEDRTVRSRGKLDPAVIQPHQHKINAEQDGCQGVAAPHSAADPNRRTPAARLGSRPCENPMNLGPSGTAPHQILRMAPLARFSRHFDSIPSQCCSGRSTISPQGRVFTQSGSGEDIPRIVAMVGTERASDRSQRCSLLFERMRHLSSGAGFGPYQFSIGILRLVVPSACSRFPMVTVSTPFLNDALIASWSASPGRFSARWKLP